MIFASPAHMLFLDIHTISSDIADTDRDVTALAVFFILSANVNTAQKITAVTTAAAFLAGIFAKQEIKENTDPMQLRHTTENFIISGAKLLLCFFDVINAADTVTAASAFAFKRDHLLSLIFNAEMFTAFVVQFLSSGIYNIRGKKFLLLFIAC